MTTTATKQKDGLSVILDNLVEAIEYASLLQMSNCMAAIAMLASMLEAERIKAFDILAATLPAEELAACAIQLDYPDKEAARTRAWDKARLFVFKEGAKDPLLAIGDARLVKFVKGLEKTGNFEMDKMYLELDTPITTDTISYYVSMEEMS